MSSIQVLKTSLVTYNEAHILKLIYFLSSKLAMFEIQSHEEAILNVLKETIKMTQTDEKITVNLSEQDFRYVENFKKELNRDFDFLKKVELKPQDNIQSGGCVILTNYGEINATIEARVEQMWKTLEESIPKSKDQVGV
jgi:flagellar assembly protein FliH